MFIMSVGDQKMLKRVEWEFFCLYFNLFLFQSILTKVDDVKKFQRLVCSSCAEQGAIVIYDKVG